MNEYRGHHLPQQSLTPEELGRILDAAKHSDLRDFAIMAVMYDCFLRVSEVLNLRVGDILPDGRVVCRRLKGSETNVLPINNPDALALVMMAVQRRDDRAALLFDYVSRRTLDWRIKKYANMANVSPEKAHAHALKHTACQLAMDATESIMVVKQLAGHADVGSTLAYADMTTDDAIAIREANQKRIDGFKRAAQPKAAGAGAD
jgi:integrase/recombinase XerD